ncbi:MAG: 30S ribosome-binding factor RbfA [Beijerinckiaceae bacterium]|nr:30S ribosome-binding factor RbfA [Beijerinckiaceae bacterium]
MKHHDDKKGPSQRQLRVGELIRHAMTEILSRGELQNDLIQSAFITIPEVRMSPDLKIATVYVTLHDRAREKDIIRAFADERKHLRMEIAHRVNLKFAPDLRFRPDEGLVEAQKIDALLRSPQVQRDLAKPQDEDDAEGEA